MNEGRVERQLAAILASDMAGYRRLMGQETGRHVWGERYDRALADIFAV